MILNGFSYNYDKIISSVGREGGTSEPPPPPEIGQIVVKIWCYLPEVYTFEAESEIEEIFLPFFRET